MDPKHEQTTNEAASSRKRHKAPEPNPQAEMKMRKAEDDVLDVIEGVESQLGALRKAHEEHRVAMTELGNQKRALEEQSSELEHRETELTSREVELAEMRQDFESREMNLIQRASGLEQRESKIASQAELLEQQEADLESKNKTLEVKINELDGQLDGLSKRKAELDTLEAQAKEKLAREDAAAAKLEAATKELGIAQSRLDAMNQDANAKSQEIAEIKQAHKAAIAELDTSKEELAKASSELQSAVSKLRGKEIELGERSHTIEELAEKAGGLEHELSTIREQYEAQIAENSELLSLESQLVEELRAKVEQLENQKNTTSSESAKRVEELTTKLNAATQELESIRKTAHELGEQGQENEGRVGGLTKELADSHAQVESLKAQIKEISVNADEALASERADKSKLKDELEQKILELSERVEQAAGSDQSNEQQTVEQQAKLDEANAQLSLMNDELAQRDQQIEEAQAKIQELADQSAELFATIEKLGTELEAAQNSPKAAPDEWTTHRKARLKKMRRILNGDAEKIRLASDALRSRYEQCEQVLMKRAELAQAYEVISSAQRKYHGREVRSGMFLGLISITAITLVLGAMSWFVADRVAPGVYAAKVTMAASGGDAKLSEADMQMWETYITQLVGDPRFMEVAADRMKRRGISEYGVPGELTRSMESSLDVSSATPGTVVLEYRGEGAQRTQRVLDTFAVALSSAANNARVRRSDSSLTMIKESAQVGKTPLDTRRIEMAGMIFGGSMLAAICLGGILWRRLSAAKARFESDSRVDGLFDDDQWQMPGEA